MKLGDVPLGGNYIAQVVESRLFLRGVGPIKPLKQKEKLNRQTKKANGIKEVEKETEVFLEQTPEITQEKNSHTATSDCPGFWGPGSFPIHG